MVTTHAGTQPPGSKVEPLTIPPGDLELGDGRRLTRGRAIDMTHGKTKIHAVHYSTKNHMAVIASLDDTEAHGTLLHVSISYHGHHPSWKDISLVKQAFFGPKVDAMMILPNELDYVNEHPHTFHLWQTPVTWGIR